MLMPPLSPRIAFVVPSHISAHHGGAEYQAHLLATNRSAEIPAQNVLYICRRGIMGDRTYNYEVRSIRRSGRLGQYTYLADAVFIWSSLKDFRPTHIYQRDAGVYTWVSRLYARSHAIPLTWHVAHDKDIAPTLVGGRNPFRWLEALLARRAGRKADRIIAQNGEQAALLEQHLARRPNLVIPNFHPAHQTSPAPEGAPLRVVWIANFTPLKRPELLCATAKALRYVQFTVLGAFEHYDPNLIQELRALPNVQLRGAQDHGAVLEALADSHLLLNTSSSEGFPNTFIEAWLSARPVVSTGVDPNGWIKQEEIGWIAPSPSELIDLLAALARAPRQVNARGEKCLDFARRHFGIENAARVWEVVLE